MIEQTIESIRAELADADARPPAFWRNNRLSVTRSITGFVDGVANRRPLPNLDFFARVGVLQSRGGYDIEETLSAFRLSGATAWREIAAIGSAAGLDAEVLFAIAESLFVYIDQLSTECARAYAAEQVRAAGVELARSTHLVRTLLGSGDDRAAHAAALAASYRLQQPLGMLAFADESRDEIGQALPAWVLQGPREEGACALVPDPEAPRRRRELERALAQAGARAALGPTVDHRSASHSLQRARAVLRLVDDGIVAAGALVLASEHTSELLIAGDRELATEFAAEQLAPLSALTPLARRRFEETLSAWLRHHGTVKAAAAELGVHPKTTAYRLARLRELFGAAIDTPDGRFELELALRLRPLLGTRDAAGPAPGSAERAR